jgi:Ulp1 family protease
MPPPETISEDSGFEALMSYSKKRKDEVVVQWDGGGMLWGKSFLSLRDGRWLNDEVISGYFVLLHQHEFHGKCFFHTIFALQLMSNGEYCYENVKNYHNTTKRRKNVTPIFKYNHLYFPINQNASHWILIEFDVKKWVLQVYDPWPNGEAAVWVDRIAQYIADEYWRLYKNECPFKDKLRDNVVCSSCPKQDNGWDCGVFVCLFGYYLATEQQMSFSAEYVANYRRTIAKCLITKKLTM